MASLLSGTTIGGYVAVHANNISTYALTSVPATISPTNIYVGNAIYFGGANNYFNWDGARINSNVGIQSENSMRAPIFYDSENTAYYVDPNSTSYLYQLILSGNSYFRPNTWIQFDGNYGIYWPNHYGLHIYPNNDGSYGSLQVKGSKNSWHGIHFDSGNTLMSNASEAGFHQQGVGWKFRWYNGEMYISAGSTGGGTERTVIHSGNIGSQSVSYATSAGNADTVDSLHASDFVRAYTTTNDNIDSDWGQSFKTFDPVPGGTPPIASPNLRTINVGNDFNRRTQLAFTYATDQAWFRRRDSSGWQTWREFIHSGNIGSQSVSYADESGYSASSGSVEWTSVQNKPATFTPSAHTHSISNVTGLQTALDGKLSTVGTAANSSQLEGFSAYALVVEARGAHSGSDFPNGTLVQTDINANGFAGNSFVMEVSGKSYDSGNSPFKLIMQGYLYADTIINVSAMSYGSYFPGPVKVMRYNGNVAFWWPRGSYWNSFQVHVRSADGESWNRVTNITDSVDPASADKKISITPVQVIHTNNIGSQSVSYATSAGNADTVDGYHESAFWRDNQDRRINVLRFYGEGGNSGNGLPPYAIYQGGGDWTWPYPDLHIAYHTGIKLGANSSYQGIRFYTDYDMSSQVMSVNNGSDPLGGGNVYVNNSLQAGSSLRAPIFYDSNDTGYYGDFASTSNLNDLQIQGDIKMQGSDSYIWMPNNNSLSTGFYDPVSGLVPLNINGPSDGIFVGNNMWLSYNTSNNNNYNENIRLFPSANGASVIAFRASAGTTGGSPSNSILGYSDRFEIRQGDQWQLRSYANYVEAYGSFRAPIFYDSNDTNYYGDFASTSRMNTIVYDDLKWAGDQTYGLIGRNGYLDTLNGRGTDPLELNYYDGGPVKIGSGAYGSKDLYASMVYVSSGNAVIHSGNIGSQNVNASNYQYATGSSSDAIFSFRQTPAHATSFREISSSGPAGTWWMIQNFRHSNSSSYWGTQVAWGWEDNSLRLMQRNVSADNWSGWVEYLNSNNFTSWAQQKENQRLSTSNDVTFNVTTSPTILVNNHSDNTKGYRIYNTSNSSVSAMFVNSSNHLVIGAGAFARINLNKDVHVNGVSLGVGSAAPSATAGRIDASNDIVAYSSSDERLKHNITPIENALDKVKSLTGVEFDWKPEYKQAHGYEGHDTGIIAQQVQAVIPSAVRTNDTGFLAVRYEKLIGLLIEGMKEQQAQIDELKAKVDGLTK